MAVTVPHAQAPNAEAGQAAASHEATPRPRRRVDRDRVWDMMVNLRASPGEHDAYEDLYEVLDGGSNTKPIPLHVSWQDHPIVEFIRPPLLLPLRMLCHFCCPNVHVIGQERIPKTGPVILAANHGSHADTAYLYVQLRGWMRHAIGAAAARDVCFQGVPMSVLFRTMFNVLAVQRRGSRSASMVDELANWLKSRPRRLLLLYPEGGRGFQGGRLGPFKKGVSRIALLAGATLVPVCIQGVNEVLPKGRKMVHRTKKPITIEYLDPIDPKTFCDPDQDDYVKTLQLTAELRNRLERALGLDLTPPPAPRERRAARDPHHDDDV